MQEKKQRLVLGAASSTRAHLKKSVIGSRLARNVRACFGESRLFFANPAPPPMRTRGDDAREYRAIALTLLLFLLPFFELLPHKTLWLCLLAALSLAEYLWSGREAFKGLFKRLSDKLVLLFSAFYLLGALSPCASFLSALKGATVGLLILLYFPASAISPPLLQKRVLPLLSVSLFLVSLYGTAEYLLGLAELKWVDLTRFGDIGGRSTSFFSNPNFLAVYLLLHIPLLLGFLCLRGTDLSTRVLALAALALSLFCLAVTWSRSAWLGIIVAVLTLALLFSDRTRRALLVLFLPLSLLLGACLPQSVLHRFGSIFIMQDSSARYRLSLWRGVCKTVFANRFGVGVGEEAFLQAYLPFAVSGTESAVHSHHLILQICCEVGWGGGLTFLLLLFVTVLQSMAKREEDGNARVMRIAAFSGVLGGVTAGMFDHVWYHFGMLALFWTLLGICSSVCKKEDPQGANFEGRFHQTCNFALLSKRRTNEKRGKSRFDRLGRSSVYAKIRVGSAARPGWRK